MTRFWITLEQGVNFVLKCLENMHGGEVFVPKLPSMKIIDLAKALCPACEFDFIGIRPGEKCHEVLIPKDDARQTREFRDYYVIEPNFPFWDKTNHALGKPVKEGFEYTSDTNDLWLTEKQLLEMVKNL